VWSDQTAPSAAEDSMADNDGDIYYDGIDDAVTMDDIQYNM